MRRLLTSLLLLVSIGVGNAFAYGRQGHQAIAELARGMLQPQARKAIVSILGDDDLPEVSNWADDLKQARRHSGPLSGDLEAESLNRRFPDNGEWHFVDLPLGTRSYSLQSKFASPHDVVHEIERCVRVLESHEDAGDLSHKEALLLLVHLVGDLHQPLHVGTGFYDLKGAVPKLVTDPRHASGLADDKGGNLLRSGNGRFQELHAYWDNPLVEKVARTKSYRKLAAALASRIQPRAWRNSGDYHHWPEQWATQSVHQARLAYSGIVFLKAEKTRNGRLKLIRIRLPKNYEARQIGRAADQLARAGFDLAALLNGIRWANAAD